MATKEQQYTGRLYTQAEVDRMLREARIEEVTRIRKRVGGSTVATNEYRAWLDERISALKETTKDE